MERRRQIEFPNGRQTSKTVIIDAEHTGRDDVFTFYEERNGEQRDFTHERGYAYIAGFAGDVITPSYGALLWCEEEGTQRWQFRFQTGGHSNHRIHLIFRKD